MLSVLLLISLNSPCCRASCFSWKMKRGCSFWGEGEVPGGHSTGSSSQGHWVLCIATFQLCKTDLVIGWHHPHLQSFDVPQCSYLQNVVQNLGPTNDEKCNIYTSTGLHTPVFLLYWKACSGGCFDPKMASEVISEHSNIFLEGGMCKRKNPLGNKTTSVRRIKFLVWCYSLDL